MTNFLKQVELSPVNDIPVKPEDPINTAILSVAEDQLNGFHQHPFHDISRQTGIPIGTVLERLKAMKQAGVIRRLRQTLKATNLAQGALVAWNVSSQYLDSAFEWLKAHDPFTGHIVIRTTDGHVPGNQYQLWTTLKVPAGLNTLDGHCQVLAPRINAQGYVLLPPKGIFSLGVGHIRRRGLRPGDRTSQPASMDIPVQTTPLTPLEWSVLKALKEELIDEELVEEPWQARADSLDLSLESFCQQAHILEKKGVIGRFAAFLEHSGNPINHTPVSQFNGLFHWAVPPGMEIRAGAECGRHICMTHCYWRSGGEPFGGAQIMGVVHGQTKNTVLAHKAAIDQHLVSCGIPVLHTTVFWSLKSEIRPSEISPEIYSKWLNQITSF